MTTWYQSFLEIRNSNITHADTLTYTRQPENWRTDPEMQARPTWNGDTRICVFSKDKDIAEQVRNILAALTS